MAGDRFGSPGDARSVEQVYGFCVELGLDVGVTRSGDVRLIEVNSRPLKVSLGRLGDAAVDARIFRYPIHVSAAIDMVPESAVDAAWRLQYTE